MFSIVTTMFYMLSAYIAFIIGYSPELPIILAVLVPLGFVAGYLFDRLNSVKLIWLENRYEIYQLVMQKYLLFLLLTALFFAAGYVFAMR